MDSQFSLYEFHEQPLGKIQGVAWSTHKTILPIEKLFFGMGRSSSWNLNQGLHIPEIPKDTSPL